MRVSVTEKCRVCDRTLEVEVRRMLPGEPEAAKDLNCAVRDGKKRPRAQRFCQAGDEPWIVRTSLDCPDRVVRRRAGVFDEHEHVCASVLDRLKRTNLSAELPTR